MFQFNTAILKNGSLDGVLALNIFIIESSDRVLLLSVSVDLVDFLVDCARMCA